MRTIIAFVATIGMLMGGCGASAREKAINATYTSVNVARDEFVRWDGKHQMSLVDSSSTREEAQEKLSQYRSSRDKIVDGFIVVYQALATAVILADDHGLVGLTQAFAELQKIIAEVEK